MGRKINSPEQIIRKLREMKWRRKRSLCLVKNRKRGVGSFDNLRFLADIIRCAVNIFNIGRFMMDISYLKFTSTL